MRRIEKPEQIVSTNNQKSISNQPGQELKISKNKTEYIEYDFGGRDQEVDETRRGEQ